MTPFRIRVAAALVAAAFAQGAAGADFLDTYRLAKQNDAVFAASRAQLEAGIEKLPQGRALLLPVINGTANTTHNDGENRTINFSNTYNSNGWAVTLTHRCSAGRTSCSTSSRNSRSCRPRRSSARRRRT